MKRFVIPVTWTMAGEYVIEADTLNEAIAQAKNKGLPEERQYVSDSMQYDTETAHEDDEGAAPK